MKDLTSSLDPAGGVMRLEILEKGQPIASIDLDAGQLADVITALEIGREKMADKIPMTIDPGAVRFNRVILNPPSYVGAEAPFAKRFLLAVRHPGLGWLPFSYDVGPGQIFTEALMAQVMRIRSQEKPTIIRP